MSRTDIARLENTINDEKRSLFLLEVEKATLINTTESKQREIRSASERIVGLPNSGPLMMGFLREASALQSALSRDKLALEQQIANKKRIIEMKERELVQMKNSQQTMWSTCFK